MLVFLLEPGIFNLPLSIDHVVGNQLVVDLWLTNLITTYASKCFCSLLGESSAYRFAGTYENAKLVGQYLAQCPLHHKAPFKATYHSVAKLKAGEVTELPGTGRCVPLLPKGMGTKAIFNLWLLGY